MRGVLVSLVVRVTLRLFADDGSQFWNDTVSAIIRDTARAFHFSCFSFFFRSDPPQTGPLMACCVAAQFHGLGRVQELCRKF